MPCRRFILLLLIAMPLMGCGNKGPLVRAPAGSDASTPQAPPPAPAPRESDEH